MTLRHGSLFSGIGGFDLAAEWMGWGNIFHVEREPFCQAVLKKHFPESQGFDDVKTFDGLRWHGAIDILTGGFPCQPYSVAGKRRGKEDDRALWPEMLRIISEIRPSWVVGENVAGFINMGFDDCASDLESQGYEVQAFVIPACSVNAPHRRDRIWIVAYSEGERQWNGGIKRNFHQTNGGPLRQGGSKPSSANCKSQNMAIISDSRRESKRAYYHAFNPWGNWIEIATKVCGNDDGLPGRSHRFKSLGNAIVPQIAYEIFKGIQAIEGVK